MQRYNQLINNKFNSFDLLIIILFSFLPLSFVFGNAAININIFLIDIVFLLYCFQYKDWSWLKSKVFIVLFIFYLFLILNSVFAYYIILENEIEGIKRSLLFIKFIILVFAISTLLINENKLNLINKSWLIISLIIIFDIFYERYFGKNLLGYTSPNYRRVVSFFKDEMVVGGYMLCFGFVSITYFLNTKLNKKLTLIYLLILLIIPISIFLTGERSNFIKSIFIFLIITFFLNKEKYLFNGKILLPIFILIITCIIYLNENLKTRYSQFFIRISAAESTLDFYQKFENIKYIAHYDTAIKIFKNYPLTGVGNKNFRHECSKDIYFEKKIKLSDARCSTHPHQIHFELLSEQGIIGYFFIIFSIIFFLFKNIKVFINTSNINHLSNISYIIVFFLPVLPGAGIFSTFNGSIFWIIFSLCYLNYKTANTKKINQNYNLSK